MNLYIGNIPYTVNEGDLKQLFSQFGEVTSLHLVKDKITKRSKGFGFVEMADSSSGSAAMNELNGKEYNGRKLIVSEAKPREEKPRFNRPE